MVVFSMAILYLESCCLGKHPYISGCLGFQIVKSGGPGYVWIAQVFVDYIIYIYTVYASVDFTLGLASLAWLQVI